MRVLNQFRLALVGAAVVCFSSDARALDSNRMTAQYVREQWNTERGFPGGHVHAIVQTTDGYLWIGTDNGLVRFDGLNFRTIPFSPAAMFSTGPVLGLITDADGNLLVRLEGAVLLRRSNGKFESFIPGLGPTVSNVTAMWRETNGGVLLTDLIAGTLRFREQRMEVLAGTKILPGSAPVVSLAETSDGKIWMGTLGAGLFYMTEGGVTSVRAGLPDRKINCLLPDGDNDLWVGTDTGLFHWDGSAASRTELPPLLGHVQVLTMLRDRDSNVWVGTTRGLLRVNASGISFSDENGFGGDGGVDALFEDREGNVWVGSARGVERIRDSAFVTYSPTAGRTSERNGPVYIDAENKTWFAPAEGGLYWLRSGRAEPIREASIGKDVVYSIAGQKSEIWLGRQNGGLTHLRFENASVTSQTYSERDGLAQNSVYAVYQSRDGAVWAGTLSGGVSRFKDGRFATYTTASGLASNTVYSILETRDDTTWFATSSGLNSLLEGHWRTYTSRDGLPTDSVNCLFEDSAGVLWIGTASGIAFLNSGSIQTPRAVPESLREQILGIQEDKSGSLWVATSNHVLRVNRDKLLRLMVGDEDMRDYGLSDGLRSTEGVKRNRSVFADSLGRIWFSMSRGLSVVDPRHLSENSAAAIAHVEMISADGSPIGIGDTIHVPASNKRITFSYTGLSLAVPERVRFRYFLEGFDRNWSEPTAAREAVYTNLGPGSYRFRVVASNSDGMWNGSETALPIEVAPALWQTWWFRSSIVLIIGLAVFMFFRLRVLGLTKQMNMRFEERLAERTRIAQELHDTLLQGFLSASMQLHVADDHLAADSPAKPLVGRVLELMGSVIDEGRNAVRGLRLPYRESEDLEQALAGIQQELGVAQGTGFHVVAEGVARPLRPAIREEVYRVGREALVNAFRHSRASSVEVELEYAPSHLRLLVRDNGSGIDPEVVRAGREGHWGLSGMRERAERVGGRLRVMSSASAGTEIELSVPSHIAYFPRDSGRPSKWLNVLQPRKGKGTERSVGSERVG
jgi:signal transduction histidine kinase/ligand-binding sensor domain-containing protein